MSESSDFKTLSTTAFTPEFAPVMVVPTNWSEYVSTGMPWKLLFNWTQKYNWV